MLRPGEIAQDHLSLAAKGTPYIVNAGIYSDTATVKEPSKLSGMK
ncbi:MAG TPA: hypothetical protein VIX14_00375 [Terriglobales bacterium]